MQRSLLDSSSPPLSCAHSHSTSAFLCSYLPPFPLFLFSQLFYKISSLCVLCVLRVRVRVRVESNTHALLLIPAFKQFGMQPTGAWTGQRRTCRRQQQRQRQRRQRQRQWHYAYFASNGYGCDRRDCASLWWGGKGTNVVFYSYSYSYERGVLLVLVRTWCSTRTRTTNDCWKHSGHLPHLMETHRRLIAACPPARSRIGSKLHPCVYADARSSDDV